MAAWNAKIRRAPTRKLALSMLLCWAMLAWIVPRVGGSLAEQHAAASWPSTTATVVQSGTVIRGLKTRLRFTYEYNVGGRTYSSSTRRRAELSGYYLFQTKGSFAAAHPVGSVVRVWYDPADPACAAIDVGLSWLDVVLPLVILVGGAIGTLEGTAELWRRVRGRRPDVDEDRWLADAIAEANAGKGRPAREVIEELRRANERTIEPGLRDGASH